MHVTRASLYEGARDATGTAVIIDVYRAFTTAAFCIAAGATEVVLTASHGAALKLKAKDPTLFLTGTEPPIVPKLMRFTDQAEWPDWFPMRDALLAGEVDRFDFALPVTREDGLLVARSVKV